MLRSLKLMKSTSTPSLPKLNNDDLLGDKSNAATWGANGEDNNSGGDRLHSVYHESFGRPLMAHRRSLSPDNTSSTATIAMLGSRTDRRAAVQPTRLEENIFEDIEEAVAAVGMGAWQAPVLLLTMLVGFADAVEVMVLSVAGPAINCAWGLSEVEEALLGAVVASGQLVGSPLWVLRGPRGAAARRREEGRWRRCI